MVLHCSLINLISPESRDYPYIMIIVFFQVIYDQDPSSFRCLAIEEAGSLRMQICVAVFYRIMLCNNLNKQMYNNFDVLIC